MLLIPLGFPRVVVGKITGKTFKESILAGAGKGREEALKLYLSPRQIVQESNPNIEIRVALREMIA